MKIKNTAVKSAARQTASALWNTVETSFNLASCIATLCQASGENYKEAGIALAEEWLEIGGNITMSSTTRALVEACAKTNLTKKETSVFVNATGFVSKQRVSQIIGLIFDGKEAKKEKSKGGLTFEQVLAAIGNLPSITEEQAKVAAKLLASKVA
jgi:hypothetical protein